VQAAGARDRIVETVHTPHESTAQGEPQHSERESKRRPEERGERARQRKTTRQRNTHIVIVVIVVVVVFKRVGILCA
jgi:hypothetical protein